MEAYADMRRARALLGTFVEIAGASGGADDLGRAFDAAFAVVARVHRLMSFHDPQSDLSRLNSAAGDSAVRVHPWTYQVLQTALELHRDSAGLFDVAVAPALQHLGVLPLQYGDVAASPKQTSVAEAVELLGDCRVRRRGRGAAIDLGGIAKGFAVDRALEVLREHGLAPGLVNAGGDLAAFGAPPEWVHIRHPAGPRRLLAQVEIADAALASSGRMFDPLQFADVGHCAVIDPRSGAQVCAIAGATVRAPSCMIADALTKVVMIAGEAAASLLTHYRASALLVFQSGEIRATADWQDGIRLAA